MMGHPVYDDYESMTATCLSTLPFIPTLFNTIINRYVQRLAEMVVLFQEKVDDLLVIEEEIDVDVRSLETCQFNAPEIKETLAKIQRAVDDLSLHQYSNLHAWVSKLDEDVERRLSVRLQAAIEEAHDKIHNDQRLTVAMRNRLKSLYEEGVRNAEKVLWCPSFGGLQKLHPNRLGDVQNRSSDFLGNCFGNTECHCSHFFKFSDAFRSVKP